MGEASRVKDINKFGLIGKDLSHSSSKLYFTEKFKTTNQKLNTYQNYEFLNEKELADFLLEEVYTLKGFNITIPYKETIIPYLDKLTAEAERCKAVNTVLLKNGELIGYNTDVFGFIESLKPLLKKEYKKAIILGTGGAAKSVAYALTTLGLNYIFVSRKKENKEVIRYTNLDEDVIKKHQIIVNCTPIGTTPNTHQFPNIPYQYINDKHLLYDLIYNPEKTKFLQKAEEQGAQIQNGLKMLHLQAEKSWEIWNSIA